MKGRNQGSQEICIPYSELDGSELYILGSADAQRDSFVNVVTQDLMRGGHPIDGGIYDAHMGTTDHSWDCKTCHQDKKLCEGHFGSVHLKYPVLSPLFIKLVIKWLKIICFGCGKLVIIPKQYKLAKSELITAIARDMPAKKTLKCVHCGSAHPHIVKDTTDYVSINAELYDDSKVSATKGKLVGKVPLYPHLIKIVFDRVTAETVAQVGQPIESHPSRLILTHIRVPPNTIRPNINKIGGGRSNNNDLTVLLQIIMKFNEKLPNTIPKEIDQDMQIQIHNINLGLYELIKGSAANSTKRGLTTSAKNAQLTSIAKRIPRKEGRIRRNLNGKRVQRMARSSITCDPSFTLDTVGVPLAIAKNIQVPEIVRDYNFKQMEIYFLNGINRYPGCTKIKKARTGTTFWIGKANTTLEIGDTIYRDVITGDPINFNRQPSLESSSITSLKVRVMERGGTFRYNVLICSLFGADFDGDEQNALFCSSKRTENEISMLANTANFFISYKNARPKICLVQDSVIGIATMTESKVKLDKLHAMRVFEHARVNPVFSGTKNQTVWSGRNMVTKYLTNSDNKINFTTKASIFNQVHAPFRVYDKKETDVKIDRGVMISGVLDENSIGGARGSIFHVVNSKSGPEKALDTVFGLQQIAHSYQFNRGNSINIADFILGGNKITKIREIEAGLIADSIRITHQLQRGKIIPPIGKTVTEYYESLQMNALDPGDAFWEHILSGINVETNNFYKMVITGARGKLSNFKNVVAALGGIDINGERMKEIFGGRVLPYFTKDDSDPRSRGYIANSYISGLDSAEFIMHTMEARYALINKALSTSITGEQNRRAIKNLESSCIDNQRKLAKDRKIIQLIYGGDGVDARSLELVSFPTMSKDLTTEEFEKKFKSTPKDFQKTFHNKNVEQLIKEEFDALTSDRKAYQTLFLNYEQTRGTPYTDKANLPVNVGRIIDDVIFNLQLTTAKPIPLDPVEALTDINTFLQRIDYVLINEIQWRKRSQIPTYMRFATQLLKINIRSYCNLKSLQNQNITNVALKLILQDILIKYSKSLIAYGTSVGILAAQSISEPMTQMVLNSHKTSGIASTKKKGMFRIKEVLGARPTNKMKGPTMILVPKQEFRKNKSKVQEIANHIEMMELRRFVEGWQLFFEEYKVPTHPKYKHETAMIEEFEKYNIHIKPPADLTNWVLRLEINKSELIIKQMKVETIYNKLRTQFPFLHIVYTHDNSDAIVMRVYVRNSFAKKGMITVDQMQDLMEQLLNTIVRGINGIKAAYVHEVNVSEPQPDGSLKTTKIFQIFTDGTNVEEILENPSIEPTTVQSDSVIEMAEIFGIECGRTKVIDELRGQVDAASYRHYTVYADEMCFNGSVTGIDRYGSKKRDASFMLRISDASPMAVIEDAAINHRSDSLKGVSAPIMMGKAPEIGDLYNSFKIDPIFVQSKIQSLDSVLDAL
jgi:DNA-directed RNA polymerase II subunit RPB1